MREENAILKMNHKLKTLCEITYIVPGQFHLHLRSSQESRSISPPFVPNPFRRLVIWN
jgi:hypothetical protein